MLRKVLNFKIETGKLFHKYIIKVSVNLLYTFSLERLMCSESFFCRFIETALYDFDGQRGSCWCLDRSKQFFMWLQLASFTTCVLIMRSMLQKLFYVCLMEDSDMFKSMQLLKHNSKHSHVLQKFYVMSWIHCTNLNNEYLVCMCTIDGSIGHNIPLLYFRPSIPLQRS